MASADGTEAKKGAVISDVTADKQTPWLLCPHRCITLTGTTSPAACSAVFSKMTHKRQEILTKFLWTETTDCKYILFYIELRKQNLSLFCVHAFFSLFLPSVFPLIRQSREKEVASRSCGTTGAQSATK